MMEIRIRNKALQVGVVFDFVERIPFLQGRAGLVKGLGTFTEYLVGHHRFFQDTRVIGRERQCGL